MKAYLESKNMKLQLNTLKVNLIKDLRQRILLNSMNLFSLWSTPSTGSLHSRPQYLLFTVCSLTMESSTKTLNQSLTTHFSPVVLKIPSSTLLKLSMKQVDMRTLEFICVLQNVIIYTFMSIAVGRMKQHLAGFVVNLQDVSKEEVMYCQGKIRVLEESLLVK